MDTACYKLFTGYYYLNTELIQMLVLLMALAYTNTGTEKSTVICHAGFSLQSLCRVLNRNFCQSGEIIACDNVLKLGDLGSCSSRKIYDIWSGSKTTFSIDSWKFSGGSPPLNKHMVMAKNIIHIRTCMGKYFHAYTHLPE